MGKTRGGEKWKGDKRKRRERRKRGREGGKGGEGTGEEAAHCRSFRKLAPINARAWFSTSSDSQHPVTK